MPKFESQFASKTCHQTIGNLVDLSTDTLLAGGSKYRANMCLDWINVECKSTMTEAGVEFRATKDLDIVLCLEALDKEFVEAFWAFIKAGGYHNQQRSSGKKIFYRLNHPEDKDFPSMLELFSRAPDLLILGDDSHLTPIPLDEDVSSLSVILLNDGYYQFLHHHKHEIEGMTVVNEIALIPLKAKAWLDLTARRQAGEDTDSRDIKKHKNDAFRLFQM